jgi:hypothetical protein
MSDFVSSTIPCSINYTERPDQTREGWYFAEFQGYSGELYYNTKTHRIACNEDTGNYGLFPAKEAAPQLPIPLNPS